MKKKGLIYNIVLLVLSMLVKTGNSQNGFRISIDSSISILSSKLENKKRSKEKVDVQEVLTLSGSYNKRSRYKEAYLLIDHELNHAIAVNSKREIILLTIEKADIFKYLGKNDEALKLYFRAEDLLKSFVDDEVSLKLLISISEFYRKIGRYKDAFVHLERARNLLQKTSISDTAILIRYYNRFAAVQNEAGGDSIAVYSVRAIHLSRLIHDSYSEAVSMNELGLYFKNRAMLDTSMACYKRAESSWKSVGAMNDAARAMFNRAQLISHNYMPHKLSVKILDEIIKLYNEGKIDFEMHHVYNAQCDNYFFIGDSVNRNKYLIMALKATVEADRKRYESDITKVKEKYENEKMQAEMNQVSSRLAIAEEVLKLKEDETKRIYVFLGVVTILLLTIGFLFYRIYFANKRLEERYKEKEALIQEIHHRVKNNLQFISSLINMQINASPELEVNHAFQDATRRIKAMSLVHEMLYNNDNVGGILINKYLEELVNSMNDLVNTREIPVDFQISCKEIEFSTTNAIALGMIISELISNSIKYAFNGVSTPSIKIELEMESGRKCNFHYSDNGMEAIELKKDKKTLGLRLIDIFSRQLKGTYNFKYDKGLHYYLNFNA